MSSRIVLVLGLAACGSDTVAGQDASTDAPAIDAPLGCACTPAAPVAGGTIAIAGATELSGIAASRTHAGVVWTHDDSGDTARLFATDLDGTARGVLGIDGASATDWEDVAIAPCGGAWCLYAGDIGDNDLERASVRIYEITEPADIDGPRTTTARAFDIAYPDGPHNSEALFVDPRDGASYVISKQTSPSAPAPSHVFRMPRTAGTATAVEVGTLTVPAGSLLVTAADLAADACGVRLLVRTYTHLFELSGPADMAIAELIATTPVALPVAAELQGEAVAFLGDDRSYVTVSEGTNPTLWRATCE